MVDKITKRQLKIAAARYTEVSYTEVRYKTAQDHAEIRVQYANQKRLLWPRKAPAYPPPPSMTMCAAPPPVKSTRRFLGLRPKKRAMRLARFPDADGQWTRLASCVYYSFCLETRLAIKRSQRWYLLSSLRPSRPVSLSALRSAFRSTFRSTFRLATRFGPCRTMPNRVVISL